ncbi:hypothetical protein D8I35_07680 [Corticibacter populi]|uniref:C-type lysozyme inhibitor domain-containing protein n=1 Tax=Corticibacter populi TaxID=1550736 RepID=A0A3M6QV25_9BURK|nr:hypothetical protein [Corticibacter populi]RMX06409.1 hypothetical protein D8I35_07680 [Corticibacter populi]RZS32044.1 hypothetical protein EV687_2729 [Corticibacter populi]
MRFGTGIPAITLLALALTGCDSSSLLAFTRKTDDPVITTQAAAEPQAPALVQAPPQATSATADTALAAAQTRQLTGVDYVISKVQLGRFPCSGNTHVTVSVDPDNAREFLLEGQGFKYRMKPVTTTTGAIRLEDADGGVIWLQVATKSMLMNQKVGKRLADACVSPQQTAFNEAYQPPVVAPVAQTAPVTTATKAAPKKASKAAATTRAAAAKKK